MVYRACALDSLDNQCGDFEYDYVRYSGCIMSCTEDGCNHGSQQTGNQGTLTFTMALVAVVIVKSVLSVSFSSKEK